MKEFIVTVTLAVLASPFILKAYMRWYEFMLETLHEIFDRFL